MLFSRKKTGKNNLPLNSTLYLKFILVYIILGFLSLFTAATLASGLTYSNLKSSEADRLYAEATAMANDYLPGYFSELLSGSEVKMQLNGLSSYADAAVWLVDREGNILLSSRPDSYPSAPSQIQDFDPAESGSATYQEGDYHGYFEEDVLTVSAPVIQGFSTKGYLLIHEEVSDLADFRNTLMQAVYATVIIIYLLSFIVLLAFQFLVYRPLRRITEAASEAYQYTAEKAGANAHRPAAGYGGLPEKIRGKCIPRLPLSPHFHQRLCGGYGGRHHPAGNAAEISEYHPL